MKRQPTDIIKFPLSPLAKAGLLVKNMADDYNAPEHDYSEPHRDAHYLLMVATGGHFVIDIDFEKNELRAPAMVLIFPGQIHHIVSIRCPSGWGVSIDPSLIDEEFQVILEKGFSRSLSLDKDSAFFGHIITLMGQMEKLQTAATHPYTARALHSTLDALLSVLAGEIARATSGSKTKGNQAAIIERNFKQLLKLHYKEWKQPAKYAAELHISPAHLYDTIKKTNGDSVSGYIQQYCILEAKRMLCFTHLTVREICYQLGYQDPVYFGKIFKKMTGSTPLAFRREYRD